MFKNYIVTALRNLTRHKLYSAINIGGLAVGLAAAMLVFQFIRYETSFENWLTDADQIFRLQTSFQQPGAASDEVVMTSGVIRDLFVEDFAGDIAASTRVDSFLISIKIEDRVFSEPISFVDREFFEVFDLPASRGIREAGLADTNSILLSESTARKFFGEQDPLGKSITLDGQWEYIVAGVLQDLPSNTQLRFSSVALIDSSRVTYIDNWGAFNLQTFVKLKPGVAAGATELGLPQFINQNFPPNFFGIQAEPLSDAVQLSLMPLTDIHLYLTARGDDTPTGDIRTVLTLAIVNVLILVIAAINFTNLSTARASTRASEIGLRKVVGASRREIALQFLIESVFLALIALTVAVVLFEFALPYYADFLNIDFDALLGGVELPVYAIGITLLLGLVSGLYPALYLSSFSPSSLPAKGQSRHSGPARFRGLLVIFQFAIAIALVSTTAIINIQSSFLKDMDLGFDQNRKLVLSGMRSGAVKPNVDALGNAMRSTPGVLGVTLAHDVPPYRSRNSVSLKVPNSGGTTAVMDINSVAANYFQLFGVEPIAGRVFDEAFTADVFLSSDQFVETPRPSALVINDTAMRAFGFASPEAAIGEIVEFVNDVGQTGVVIGVLSDFVERGARTATAPIIFVREGWSPDYMVLDLAPDDLAATIAAIDGAWRRTIPDAAINRSFLDEDVQSLYEAEGRLAIIFNYFSGLGILVATLGLFGLASFEATRRTREIGIRKVLGARVADIIRLLVWQFTKPVLAANLIAWPAALWFARDWLNGFAYRIDLTFTPFLIAGGAALLIAWITVAGHAARVARTNPIHALRYE